MSAWKFPKKAERSTWSLEMSSAPDVDSNEACRPDSGNYVSTPLNRRFPSKDSSQLVPALGCLPTGRIDSDEQVLLESSLLEQPKFEETACTSLGVVSTLSVSLTPG
jgi:hypothetical protein